MKQLQNSLKTSLRFKQIWQRNTFYPKNLAFFDYQFLLGNLKVYGENGINLNWFIRYLKQR